ncbi:hypothetical protein SO802_005686 [Lithocarpus litseifolius]|uniref:Reverse transcriptase zinc-binding domain-containing protein n=1 Tax=Lithocarpus litseifolius TaxID=425828 RepID=A0AAW2DIV4_9ROSI
MVCELIDHATACWKVNVLDALFLPYEADVIKGIPLSSCLLANKLIWAEAPNGKFSVRSAYRVAMRLSKPVNQGTSSERSHLRLFWKRIWDLPLPHKVRHFAWQVCRDILPTKVNPMCRNVVKDQLCDECKLEFETIGHLFWMCPKAQEVWSCSKCGEAVPCKSAFTLGLVVGHGRLEATLSTKIKAPCGAVEEEAMAYEAGLMFAKDIGIQDFIEGDSLVIHQALCRASTLPSSVAAIVQGMQELCREFCGVEFSHVRR